MYTRREKYVLGSFFLKTVFYMTAAAIVVMNYESPHQSGLSTCQLQALTGGTKFAEEWADFKEWCDQNVLNQDEDTCTWSESAYLWFHQHAVEKCRSYTTCRTEAVWHSLLTIAAGFLLYADYLIHILAIATLYLRDQASGQGGKGLCAFKVEVAEIQKSAGREHTIVFIHSTDGEEDGGEKTEAKIYSAEGKNQLEAPATQKQLVIGNGSGLFADLKAFSKRHGLMIEV